MLLEGLDLLRATEFLANLFNFEFPKIKRTLAPEKYSAYLIAHGLTVDEFECYNFGYYSKQFGGSVAIKVPTGIRYRVLSAKGGEEKYRNKKNTTACVFKTMPSDEGIVVICEGEMDAITLHVRTGLVAWSSTAGANTVKPEFLAEFKENHTVFIVMDNDVSGQQGATNITRLGFKSGYSDKYRNKNPPPQLCPTNVVLESILKFSITFNHAEYTGS
jgi:hypothetical protein